MFKNILKKLSEIGYILTIENGKCELIDKATRKIYLTFSNNEKTSAEERILLDFYSNLEE